MTQKENVSFYRIQAIISFPHSGGILLVSGIQASPAPTLSELKFFLRPWV